MLARGYGGRVRALYLYEFGILEVGFAALVSLFPLAARLLA
jgi:hypothetical protein